MTVKLLPGAALSPEVLFHQCLQDMSDTSKAIVLCIDPDGAIEIFTSRISMHDLAYAALKLQSYAAKTIDGDAPQGTDYFIPKGAA